MSEMFLGYEPTKPDSINTEAVTGKWFWTTTFSSSKSVNPSCINWFVHDVV